MIKLLGKGAFASVSFLINTF